MVTQVVLTDDNGIFTYAAPIPGWWGFSALSTADYKLKHKGQDKNVEVGGVIWVKFSSLKKEQVEDTKKCTYLKESFPPLF